MWFRGCSYDADSRIMPARGLSVGEVELSPPSVLCTCFKRRSREEVLTSWRAKGESIARISGVRSSIRAEPRRPPAGGEVCCGSSRLSSCSDGPVSPPSIGERGWCDRIESDFLRGCTSVYELSGFKACYVPGLQVPSRLAHPGQAAASPSIHPAAGIADFAGASVTPFSAKVLQAAKGKG
eukprot:CAMPEP_0180214986 /NCGR_PEP_ID=MMETSP0987-20121128/15233_1 /TAXON_ID=697907 /ORGANISM="non described non described, Strain CCMP2293" /LENGTH=180 /DNA_ID=CAMNT_0022173571 /DNA_START=208 /DNA_END=751 /DNA_ORIENTATION=-